MSDEDSEVAVGEVGEKSSSDWIDSVDELAREPGEVEAGDFTYDFSHLDDDELNLLDEQTKRTLDRHSEVQDSQHKQAKNVLRSVVIIIGAFATATPFINSFIQSLTFPDPVHPLRSLLSLLFLVIGVILIELTASDIVKIIDSAFNILSPELTEKGQFGTLLALMGYLRPGPADEEAGGAIRSVSILKELGPKIDDPDQGLQQSILANRLNRIRRNEKVINANMDNLHWIYQHAKLGIERGIAIALLSGAILLLLGAEF